MTCTPGGGGGGWRKIDDNRNAPTLSYLQFYYLNRTVRQVDIVNPTKRNKSKRYSNSGTLRILQCHVDRQFSLVDYVRGNCVIRTVCALDFTMSNGTPLTNGSLHTMDDEKVRSRTL